nr:MAG TPA: hypothetical protein [Caudoviricetes sp.]
MLDNYYMAPCSGRVKGARLTHFKGYWLVVFYHAICGNDSVRPATEGHPPAAGKGGIILGQLGFESPAFH